jgi:PAS domain S-box-containing protein
MEPRLLAETIRTSGDALCESEQMYRLLVENSNEIIIVVQDGVVKMVNPMALAVAVGFSEQEITSNPVESLIHPDDRAMVMEHHHMKLRAETEYTRYAFRLRKKDGGVIWVRNNSVRIDWEGHPATLNFLIDITEQKKVEEELRKSENKYRKLVNSANESIVVLQDGVIRLINNMAVTGYSKQELVSMSFSAFIHPDDRAMVLERHQMRLRGEAVPRYIFRLIAKDGSTKWVEGNGVVDDWEGRPATILFMTNITEYIRVEKMLRESEELYRSILKASPDGITITDLEGRVLMVSPSAVTMFGYTREEELLDRVISECLVPEDRERAQANIELMRQGIFTGPNEYRCVRADGSMFPIEVNSEFIRDAAGQPLKIVIVIRDIAERKQTEEALRGSEMRWRFALEGSGDGVWDWNRKTNEVYFSHQLKAMLGYTEEEIGNTLDEWERLVCPEDIEKYYAALERYFRGETEVYQEEYRMRCKCGAYKWILDRGKVVEWDEDGKPLRVIGTHADITCRKQAEDAMRKAKDAADSANLDKSRFLSVIAHEFRTPLGLLTVSVDILNRYWDRLDNKSRTEQHEQIRNATIQMLHLVDSVSSFNHKDALKPRLSSMPWDVGHVCRAIAEEVKMVWCSGHEFCFEMASECGTCRLDVNSVRSVVVNLLSNAFRFTPSGGTVLLTIGRQADTLRINVVDTGIGIPEEDQKRVFESFYRCRNVEARSGLGLGLSIVSQALQRMSGSITFASKVGVGSVFQVEIPLESDSATEK